MTARTSSGDIPTLRLIYRLVILMAQGVFFVIAPLELTLKLPCPTRTSRQYQRQTAHSQQHFHATSPFPNKASLYEWGPSASDRNPVDWYTRHHAARHSLVMMQPIHVWDFPDQAIVRPLDWPRLRTIPG